MMAHARDARVQHARSTRAAVRVRVTVRVTVTVRVKVRVMVRVRLKTGSEPRATV